VRTEGGAAISYAKGTTVSINRSREELEQVLQRYGAEKFAYAWEQGAVQLAFHMEKRLFKFRVSLPLQEEFALTPSKRWIRSEADKVKAWEQGCREKWRLLLLVIKAKLEAVECGISTLEEEFLANIALPSGQTMGQWAKPEIERAYELGGELPLLSV
jgi:hypothetical protein